jgi:hypothetical protein
MLVAVSNGDGKVIRNLRTAAGADPWRLRQIFARFGQHSRVPLRAVKVGITAPARHVQRECGGGRARPRHFSIWQRDAEFQDAST